MVRIEKLKSALLLGNIMIPVQSKIIDRSVQIVIETDAKNVGVRNNDY